MTDNVAVLAGFTEQYMAYSENGQYDLFILVQPGTDFDSTFKAWDSDAQEFVRLNGWLWTLEQITE